MRIQSPAHSAESVRRGPASRHMSSLHPAGLGRLLAGVLIAGGALVLTGCQEVALYRTVYITPAPSPEFIPDPNESAGFDLHFGAASFKFTCATDSVGDSARGTAAIICTWHFTPWW